MSRQRKIILLKNNNVAQHQKTEFEQNNVIKKKISKNSNSMKFLEKCEL